MERADGLRETMVAHLERAGVLRHSHIAAAMRNVPRHRFLPDLPIEEAYADRAVAIKTAGDDVLASVSQPGMIAHMLELLAAGPGDRIVEIGTGSGYNAALLGELVGPHGSVLSIDVDEELARRAQALLRELGCANVTVRVADGA
ncbi:MAG: methyltransferase domain-containing protein, partial [Candidatus Eremiobacteraeota bacterium]|nr:methyltransferase domain-containing protein [Candidatus Eremiobacteraeota bacterium]